MRLVCLLALLGWVSSLPAEGKRVPTPQPQAQPGTTPSPATKEADPFRVALTAFTPKFNPQLSYTSAEAQLYLNLYESLIVNNPSTLRPEPGLAESWQISPDRLTYRFTLRANARFSDGTQVTAQDFVDSWLNLIAPQRKIAFASLLAPIRGVTAYINGSDKKLPAFRAEGALTLVVELHQPSPQILSILSHHSLSPLHPQLLKKDDWSTLPAQDIFTSGAYRVESFQQKEVHLIANPFYHSVETVSLPRVNFLLSSDSDRIMGDFNRRNIDWVASNVPLEQLEDPNSLQVSPMFITTFLYFRSDQPAWRDARVRSALLMLLPVDSLRRGRYADHALVPPIPTYPRVKELPGRSRERALELLAQAGYPEGVGLPKMLIRIDNQMSVDDDSHIGIVRNAWKDALNLQVELLPVDNVIDHEGMKADFSMGFLSWIGDYPDPMAFLQLWQADSSLNFFGYRDAEFDRLLDLANKLAGEERFRKLAAAEEYLLKSGALLPLSHGPAINLIDTRRFSGWSDNVLDTHPIRFLKRSNLLPVNSI